MKKVRFILKKQFAILIALFLYYILRKMPAASVFIDEETLTMGYKEDHVGSFHYPLPKFIIKKHFKGCLTISELRAKNNK